MLSADQRRMLEESIPNEVIYKKQKLDYVPAGWVIAEANRIFGADGWGHEVVAAERWTETGKDRDGKPRENRHAMVTVRVFVYTDKGERCHGGQACGTGYGPDGYHQAAAEAETDAIKRALSKFGRRLGLQLYLDQRTDAGPPKQPMPAETFTKIMGALQTEGGDAQKVARLARKRMGEYETSEEQRKQIEHAIKAATAA